MLRARGLPPTKSKRERVDAIRREVLEAVLLLQIEGETRDCLKKALALVLERRNRR